MAPIKVFSRLLLSTLKPVIRLKLKSEKNGGNKSIVEIRMILQPETQNVGYTWVSSQMFICSVFLVKEKLTNCLTAHRNSQTASQFPL
jgi:hypothetical protein